MCTPNVALSMSLKAQIDAPADAGARRDALRLNSATGEGAVAKPSRPAVSPAMRSRNLITAPSCFAPLAGRPTPDAAQGVTKTGPWLAEGQCLP